MSFKLFRRGSARCIGLLSAFVTILLCLYYISIGQPNPAPISGTGPPTAALRGSPLNGLSAFSVGGGSSTMQVQKTHASIVSNAKRASEDDFTNQQWGNKCYELLQSDTNITAREEHSKFDFQVRN